MLDDFKNEQPIAYKMLKNSSEKKTFSHAYLFETNDYNNSYNFIMSFAKTILCPNNKTNKEKCRNCHQCEVIESGNFPEIKIINPDGMWIKKSQLKELQAEFGEKALIGSKRLYIINEAEKLNVSAANSILKFLEEPEEGIIAILITNNIYGILQTIRSRCQIISLKQEKIEKKQTTIETIKEAIYKSREKNKDLQNNEEINNKIKKAIEFINYYEEHHLDTILYMQKLWHENINTKEDILNGFDVMIMYYKDIINKKLGKTLEIFTITEEMNRIAKKNTITQLCRKLNILIEKKQTIKFNANINLLMDKLIIDLDGGI